MRKMLALVVALSAGGVLMAASYTVPDGWSNAFSSNKKGALAAFQPMVIYWGNIGCTYCDELSEAFETEAFQEWMKERPYVFCYNKSTATSDDEAAKKFAQTANGKGKKLTSYPFVCLYWKKFDGTVVAKNFVGRSGSMPVTKGTLAEQFMASADKYLKEYLTGEKLSFEVADSGTNQLQAERGTKWVDVPILRAGGVTPESTSYLFVKYTGDGHKSTNAVHWAAGQTRAYARVNLDEPGFAFTAGEALAMGLYNGKYEKVGTSKIHMVEDVPNGPTNPYFGNETNKLAFGEWTMDLDAATNLAAKTEGACTFVFFTGALWCPHCRPLEADVFETEDFRTWSRENKIALALMDNPKRMKKPGTTENVDDYSNAAKNGYADLAGVPNGDAPTLLRHAVGSNGESGAGYRSRKMITDEMAEAVLQRNHDLGYAGGYFNAPGSFRTGYPTLIALDRTGKIRGRFVRNEGSGDNPYDLDENMARLREFLKLVQDGSAENSYSQTTELSATAGADTKTALSLQQRERVYRLYGIGYAGTLSVTNAINLSGEKIVYTLVTNRTVDVYVHGADGEVIRTNGYMIAETVATGTDALVAAVGTNATYYLKVSAYSADSTTRFFGDESTAIDVSFSTQVTVAPQETATAFVSDGNPIKVAVTAGTLYRLRGFTSFDGPGTPDGEFFAATDDGVLTARAELGQEVSVQVWKPGCIAFARPSLRCLTLDGTASFDLVRTNGVSGAVTVTVSSEDASACSERHAWTDVQVTFAEGEARKTVTFALIADPGREDESTFTVKLAAVEPGAHPADVSEDPLAVTVFDSTDPMFVETENAVTFWKKFDNAARFELKCVGQGQKVSLKKMSGTLPKGVTMTYEDGQAVLSGRPTSTGTYVFSYEIREVRDGVTVKGNTANFTVAVKSPASSSLNPMVGKKISNRKIPLFADCEELGDKALVGRLSLSITSDCKISAKYVGTEEKTISYSGYWQELDGDSSAVAVIEKGASVLALTMDTTGAIGASVRLKKDGYSHFVAKGKTMTGLIAKPRTDVFKNFAGYYTVQLPNADWMSGGLALAGTGALRLKMTSSTDVKNGTVTYAGVMPDGKSVSGTATLDYQGSDLVRLPVFCRTDDSVLGFQAEIIPGVKTAWKHADDTEQQRLVSAAVGTAPYHLSRLEDYWCALSPLEVYGGAYDTSRSPSKICSLFGYKANCKLTFDLSESLFPGVYGDIAALPSATAKATSTGFKLSGVKDGKLSISFSASTATFSGEASVEFYNGTVKTGKFKGVLMPGWIQCSDCGDPVLERPFGAGTLYFSDKVKDEDGAKFAVTRSVPVTLTATAIE